MTGVALSGKAYGCGASERLAESEQERPSARQQSLHSDVTARLHYHGCSTGGKHVMGLSDVWHGLH